MIEQACRARGDEGDHLLGSPAHIQNMAYKVAVYCNPRFFVPSCATNNSVVVTSHRDTALLRDQLYIAA